MSKSYLLVFFSLIFIIQSSYAVFGFSGAGSGTLGDPFQITNVAQLQEMNDARNAHYILMNNINAVSTSGWNGGQGFVPVGSSSSKFNGTFDGRNYNISNLFINRTTVNQGMFGFTGLNSVIKNVGLLNININIALNTIFGHNLGGLIAVNLGVVTNCSATGNVRYSGNLSRVGGLVGSNIRNGTYYGSITNCYSGVNVNGTRGPAGGLVGSNGGLISNSHASGSVSADTSVGGLVGVHAYGLINNSYATGNVMTNGPIGILLVVWLVVPVFMEPL